MRTDGATTAAAPGLASVRTLRLAFGTASCMWVSQLVAWDLSFIAPAMTLVILALPLPAFPIKTGIGFVAALSLSLLFGFFLLPRIMHQPLVGLLLLSLALYWTFYVTARGGPAVVGTLLTMGIAVAVGVGTVNVDALLAITRGVVNGAIVGVIFAWIAHAVIPDSLAARPDARAPPARPPAPDPADARWSAFRSLAVVLPVALFFIASSASATYIPVLIKVAAMGQQASRNSTRVAAESLVKSTLIGGGGAVIGWNLLSIAPILSVYVLFIALAGLVAGRRIFDGAGLRADAETWWYGYLTLIVILAPAVLDSVAGAAAGARFLDRLLMFVLATVYAVIAVHVFDAFRPRPGNRSAPRNPSGRGD